MPSMTVTLQNLHMQGPSLEIHFAVSQELESALKRDGKSTPEPIKVKSLIDTGATSCVVQEEIPKKLELAPVGKTKIATPSHNNYECYQYFMRLIISLPAGPLIYEGTFIAVPLDGQNIQCLIGRDFLANSDLVYTGYMNRFTLSL
ncbi:MAG: hypothetical protein HY917_01870 [Candidatus Diapherotrites archaeon]|nr:hypothetical protein [Candidatus Diapherotrites archaeon]